MLTRSGHALVGDLAPVSTWLAATIDGSAAALGIAGRTTVIDLGGPDTTDLRAEFELPAGGGSLVVQAVGPGTGPFTPERPLKVDLTRVPGTGRSSRAATDLSRRVEGALRPLEGPSRRPAALATGRRPVVVAVVVAAVVALAFAVGTRWDPADDEAAADLPSVPTAPSTSPASASTEPRTTTPGSSAGAAPSYGNRPRSSTGCAVEYDLASGPSRSAVDAATTTCPFAENVRAAYVGATESAPPTGTTIVVTAWSPKTEREYAMTCTGRAPVVCRGGTRAVVYLYR